MSLLRSQPVETVYFRLSLTVEQMQNYYAGVAQQVVVRACDGRNIQFPAQWLRQFVTPHGVHGWFRMRFDNHRKLVDFQRLGD